MSVELHILRPGQPERRVVLGSGVANVGRADDNDVVLADVGVSRRHARIEVGEGTIIIEDAGSGNGVWFQGRRVERQVLGHGEEVVIDPFTLRVQMRTPAALAEVTDGRDGTAPVAAPQAGASLMVISAHKMPIREFALPLTGSITLGRSERNQVVLPEPASSRVHAEIIARGDGVWTLRDNGSSNGTFVNARRVRERALEDGDRIRIGTVELRFAMQHATEGTEAFAEALVSAPGKALPPPPPPPTLLPPPPMPDASAGHLPRVVAPTRVSQPDPEPPPAFRPDAVELDVDPAKARAGTRMKGGRRAGGGGFFSRPINQISFGLLAVTLLMLGGKGINDVLVSFIQSRGTAPEDGAGPAAGAPVAGSPTAAPAPLGSTPGVAPTVTTAAPADRSVTDPVMAEGMTHFAAGRYFDAAGSFYRVLQLDPDHVDARRMGFLAVEFITLAEVRTALVARTTSESTRADAKAAGLDAVARAEAGDLPVAEARPLLEAALAVAPDDAELLDAKARLDSRQSAVARAATAGKAAAQAQKLGDALASAQADLDKGSHARAVKGFEAVLAADPTRASPEYYKAEEGIRTAKDRMKADSKAAWAEASTAIKAGDWLTARKRLQEVVKIDPYNDTASTKLAEARRELKEQASEIYKEARTLEGLGQNDKAISLYHKVQLYVGDESDPLSKKAQDRTDALLR